MRSNWVRQLSEHREHNNSSSYAKECLGEFVPSEQDIPVRVEIPVGKLFYSTQPAADTQPDPAYAPANGDYFWSFLEQRASYSLRKVVAGAVYYNEGGHGWCKCSWTLQQYKGTALRATNPTAVKPKYPTRDGFKVYTSKPQAHWTPRVGYVPKKGEWFWWKAFDWLLREARSNGLTYDENGKHMSTLKDGSYAKKCLPAQGP